MTQGLGRFIEGKTTLNDHAEVPYRCLEDMQDRQTAQTAGLAASTRTHAMNSASNTERLDSEIQRQLGSSRTPSRSDTPVRKRYIRHEFTEGDEPSDRPMSSTGDANVSLSAEGQGQPVDSLMGDLQEDLLSKDVRAAFERAAFIVKDALDVSGVLFLDASIGEHGQLRSDEAGSSSTSPENSDNNTSAASDKEPSMAHTPEKDRADDEEHKPCRQLGSAYDVRPDSKGVVLHRGIPERFLKSIMRRFPYGKIWNFDADGDASSSDGTSDGSKSRAAKVNRSASGTKMQRRRKSNYGPMLQELFPGVRTLALMPMWDSQRQRFFAGAFVWSYERVRVLTFQEDLNYFGAFCDVIMAEVGRLDAQREVQGRTTFMSSISHELKTPLHGILGAVECLQDKEDAALQEEMLQMIDASARSLLDIITNLIAHADARSAPPNIVPKQSSPSRRRKGSPAKGKQRTSKLPSVSEEPVNNLATLTEEVLDIAMWSTPQPAPLPQSSQRRGSESPLSINARSNAPLRVMLEVSGDESDWNFNVNAGAWRRILLNLASNSIKYTDTGGFLKVTLTSKPPDPADAMGKCDIQLICADSGRGMGEHYQKHGLWQAFSQEDSHSSGTGLGLRLVRDIVHELGGTIAIDSAKGVGTEIKISISLMPGAAPESSIEHLASPEVLNQLKSSTFTLIGFDDEDSGEGRDAQAGSALERSLKRACTRLGLRAVEGTSEANICIVSEKKALEIAESGSHPILARQASAIPVIVFCYSAASARKFSTSGDMTFPLAKAVSQPLGPRKMLRALAACLERRIPAPSQSSGAVTGRKRRCEDEGEPPSASPESLSPAASPKPTSDYGQTSADAMSESPTEEGNQQPPDDPTPSISAPEQAELCVLLVDDNRLNMRLLETFMKKHGHKHFTATNGLEAVNLVKDLYKEMEGPPPPPLVILMDITMPVMDGFEATRQVRAYERNRGIEPATIIALTAMNSAEARQEAFSSGLNDFLTKPVRLKKVSEILADHQEKVSRLADENR